MSMGENFFISWAFSWARAWPDARLTFLRRRVRNGAVRLTARVRNPAKVDADGGADGQLRVDRDGRPVQLRDAVHDAHSQTRASDPFARREKRLEDATHVAF